MTTTTDGEKQGRLRARRLLIPALQGVEAPRVLSASKLISFAKERLGIDLPETTANYNLSSLTRDGLLKNPTRGVYLNMLADPQPTIQELAPHLRAGSVLSLQTVLGQSGVLNNPTPWVTCIVPRSETSKIAGKMTVGGTVFSFSSMSRDAMCESAPEIALQPYTAIPTATPEKALLDWLYLAKHSRKWSEPPMFDIDIDMLDDIAMTKLSRMMGIENEWNEAKKKATLKNKSSTASMSIR